MSDVLISIVTRNEEEVLQACLRSLREQTVPAEIRIFDNASSDVTCSIARQQGVSVTASETNVGFSAGHNRLIAEGDTPFVLVLNADTRLDPAFVERLLEVLERFPAAGSAGGKLLRMSAGQPLFRGRWPVLDSTGIYFTPEQRHFDRGSGEPDRGQYQRRQLVFGITGAAVMFRRTMLEDVAEEGHYFDEDFFAYREDADLAWRARLKGWESVYEPEAWGWHERKVTPRGRAGYDPQINRHSLKNRFLMRIKNMDQAVRTVCTPWMQIRDAGILTYVLARERSSWSAYRQVRRLRPRMEVKRRQIQRQRRVRPEEMVRWFRFRPVAFDV